MSLTLRWNGETHFFDTRKNDPEALHFWAAVKARLTPHVFIIRSDREPHACAILKMARDAREIDYLEKEASLYENELAPLQGKYVPEYFGMYYGTVLGSPAACMLLEFCCTELSMEPEERK